MITHRNNGIIWIKNDTQAIQIPKVAVICKAGKYFYTFISMRKSASKFGQRKEVVRNCQTNLVDIIQQKSVIRDNSTWKDWPFSIFLN